MEKFWYKHELIYYEKVLNRLLNNTSSDYNRIKDNLEIIKQIWEKEKISLNIEDILLKDYLDLSKTKFLWKPIEESARLDSSFIPNLKVKEIDFTNKELFELIHDFFKNATNKEIYELFLKIYNQNKKSIHIIDKDYSYPGDTLYIDYFNKTYIQVYKDHTFEDLTTLAHEFGHAIQFNSNYNINYFKDLNVYLEIVSIFFELLCCEYFYKSEFKLNALASEYSAIYDNIESCKDLKEEFKIFRKINYLEHENKNDLKNKISKIASTLPIEYTKYFIDILPRDYYIYSFAFVVASNLIKLYKKDRDFALQVLKELINIDLKVNAYKYYQELENLDLVTTDGLKNLTRNIKRRCK